MRLTYRPAGFSGSDPRLQAGEHTVVFTRADLVHSVVTVGRRDIMDVLQFGDLSALEIIWRTAMLLANVQRRSDDFLQWSPAYGGLDPSERGAVAYFMGMTFAKLLSEHLLAVPWLMHLDVYWDDLAPTFQDGEARPDLVGLSATGDWVAVEAKGGAGNLKSPGWARAKWQLENLETVDGVSVQQRVASVTFQRRRNRSPHLHVEFRDPPPNGKGFDLPVRPEQFVTDYYARIQRIIGEEYTALPRVRSESGSLFLGSYIPEAGFWIGIAEEIARAPSPYPPARSYAALAAERRGRRGAAEEPELVHSGIDGVAVVLDPSWNQRLGPAAPADEPDRRRRR